MNRRFVGPGPSRRISPDQVEQPSHWGVKALDAVAREAGLSAAAFRDLCMLKWSFNTKPDLVVLMPGLPAISVEGKLESVMGRYPSGGEDGKFFGDWFKNSAVDHRVRQLELQRFLFERVLGKSVVQVSIERKTATGREGVVGLAWKQVFGAMDLAHSTPFVRRYVELNTHLG